MTVNDIIAKTRVILNDGTGSEKYPDTTIISAIGDAIRHLWSVNPVTRKVNGVIVETPIPTLATDIVPVSDKYGLGLSYYAAARCYEGNITDTVNAALANGLFAKAAVEFQ